MEPPKPRAKAAFRLRDIPSKARKERVDVQKETRKRKKMRFPRAYDRIVKLARACGLARHDADAFYAAYELAMSSEYEDCRVGCVITVGNQIIGRGCNSTKSDPTQKAYNLRHREFTVGPYSNREHSRHAEMAALKSISYPVAKSLNWNKTKAYVFRVAPGLPLGQGMSAPCCACAHALADAGVRKVFFSTEYGFATGVLTSSGDIDAITRATGDSMIIGSDGFAERHLAYSAAS